VYLIEDAPTSNKDHLLASFRLTQTLSCGPANRITFLFLLRPHLIRNTPTSFMSALMLRDVAAHRSLCSLIASTASFPGH
jgi:hypothetical protein